MVERRARTRRLLTGRPYTGHTWAGMPTCRERARVPTGRGVPYVYISARVVRAVVYACYVWALAHVSSVRYSV